ncbi:MAG: DUF2911 domain-containing protein [Gemmatimonadales bacterium]|nr:DUF2911 domain-containing protein [Gemmatimonadales bacterium]
MRRTSRSAAILALTATIAGAGAGCAERTTDGAQAYVQRLGRDTLAIEIFTRVPGRIEGRVLIRQPHTRVGSYTIALGADGMPSTLEVNWDTPNRTEANPPPLLSVATIEGDSVVIRNRTGSESDTTLRVAGGEHTLLDVGASPPSVAVWEEALALARASGDSVWPFTLASAGWRPGPVANRITRLGGDSVSMQYHGDPMVAHVDRDGRVLTIDGSATTLKIASERVPATFDFDSVAAEFAARDARGEGFGPASPRGMVDVTGGGAHFTVDYSRPSVRGREIWGALVPYGSVWRTGANAATHFTTDRALMIGTARVPAGTYTLWTTFTADTDTLIINAQTRIWGTAYDPSQDLVRVPLERTELADPVELFTIAIEPAAQGGTLQLVWDRRLLSVKMRVAR